MMKPSEQSEEDVFAAALVLPTAEARAAWLDAACGERPTMRQRVEVLLAAHDRAGKFLETALVTSDMAVGPPPLVMTLDKQPGERIGRYLLLENIGEGGCGVVYVAEQEEPVRRRVALKLIKAGMGTKEVIARFAAERQVLAMMDHPNIARVFDAGTIEEAGSPTAGEAGRPGEGRPYFVMELVEGIPITEYCEVHRLSVEERLHLFSQVCHAVHHAHQRGVIHRDIKPSNILVTRGDPPSKGVPKVIDFGIAKVLPPLSASLDAQTYYTRMLHFVGTPAYMSPEQADMKALDIDTRSDIYSLGVLLYELLTDQTPFDTRALMESGLEEMRRIIREQEPLRPSTRLARGMACPSEDERREAKIAAIDRDLDWITMKCLEKDRARRYETANGLVQDIHRYLRHEPIAARPPSPIYRCRKWMRRNKLGFGLSVAGVAVVILTLIVLAVANVRIAQERNEKDIALGEREAAVREAHRRELEAREQWLRSLANESRAHRYSRRMGQRWNALARLEQAAAIRPQENLRDNVIAATALPDLRLGPSWSALTTSFPLADFDDDYLHSVQIGEGGVLVISTVPEGREIKRIPTVPTEAVYQLRMSPDGRHVVRLESDHRVRVWRVEDGQSVLSVMPENCSVVVFSGDGRQLAVSQEEWIARYDLTTGQEINRWRAMTQIHSLAFDPRNERLAVGYKEAEKISIYEVDDGRLVAELDVGSMRSQVTAWHPDGNQLAVSGVPTVIQVWDLSVNQLVSRLEGSAQLVSELSFHPSGTLLVSRGWDGVVRLWEPVSGRLWLQAPMEAWVRFSGDGRHLGVGTLSGPRFQLMEVAVNPEYRCFGVKRGLPRLAYYEGDISSDGRWLALGMQDGAGLWDLEKGRQAGFIPLRSTPMVSFLKEGFGLISVGVLDGLSRWDLEDVGEGQLRVGPAQLLQLPFGRPTRFWLSEREGRIGVVSESTDQVWVGNMSLNGAPVMLEEHPGAGDVELSSDGRRAVTGGWLVSQVRLWDTATGRVLHDWGPLRRCRVGFTSDDRELIIGLGDRFEFYDVETYQLSRQVIKEVALYPNKVPFSRDGRWMAMEMSPGIVDIKEAATAKTVARLEDPFGDRATWMMFHPAGTELVVVDGYASTVRVWDLRAIQERLRRMGLAGDWRWAGGEGGEGDRSEQVK